MLFTEGGLSDDLDTSELGRYSELMDDAPFNDRDIEWEARASWGDPEDPDGAATVWKVDDDLDFDALADDLEDKGYTTSSAGTMTVYSVDTSSAGQDGTIGGVYPPIMLNVLLAEDEQIVAASAADREALLDVAAVIVDDDDSLADDGGFEDLLDVADDDPDIAWLARGGPAVCTGTVARALFVFEDEDVRLALQYDGDDDAKTDLKAREELVENGVDPVTREPFADLGSFELEQDGDRVVIDEDFEGGARAALRAERKGGGPGVMRQPLLDPLRLVRQRQRCAGVSSSRSSQPSKVSTSISSWIIGASETTAHGWPSSSSSPASRSRVDAGCEPAAGERQRRGARVGLVEEDAPHSAHHLRLVAVDQTAPPPLRRSPDAVR